MPEIGFAGGDGCELSATVLGQGPPMVLLHAGGPDRRSLLPLARLLRDRHTLVLPDIRGYGASVCADPSRHTWRRYTEDLFSLLDHLELERAAVGGTGLGSTISLRAALHRPERVARVVLIGVEDIEDDDAKAAEIEFLDAFAARASSHGLNAAWEPILAGFPPVVGAMVRDAIPRSDPASVIAAAAIGRDRSFADVTELGAVVAPTLVIPGTDWRHPRALAERCAETIPNGVLAPVAVSPDLRTAEDLARRVAPSIRDFLAGLPAPPAG
ncbi:alpha/beta fold hydrolase [Nocardiopsis mangrovi]|uniref:Alpha/beta fold hydrolase n=1 Tax=Nocardiopsis mangrovi TaxID=1179818 RepID=A0ABV9E308_9ACTN